VLVSSGSVGHTQGGRTMELGPRSMLYLQPAERHSDVFGDSGANCIVIEIDQSWIRQRLGTGFEGPLPSKQNDTYLYALGTLIHQELKRPDDLSMLIVEGSLLQVFARWRREQRRRLRAVPPWLQRARNMLRECFQSALSLRDISREAGVHPARLVREFHRSYGITPGAYVRTLRVEFVVDRLNSPQNAVCQNLSDIALEAGFSSHAHMTVAFKRVTGLTPSEFRKAHRLESTR
jgi:AraC family transcriptional regulator